MQVDEISKSNSSDGHGDTLGANVVGEDLAVEDNASDVDTASVEEEEHIAVLSVRACQVKVM